MQLAADAAVGDHGARVVGIRSSDTPVSRAGRVITDPRVRLTVDTMRRELGKTTLTKVTGLDLGNVRHTRRCEAHEEPVLTYSSHASILRVENLPHLADCPAFPAMIEHDLIVATPTEDGPTITMRPLGTVTADSLLTHHR